MDVINGPILLFLTQSGFNFKISLNPSDKILNSLILQVTPANTFDLLNEDFDYWLIGIVLLGLCVATIVTHALAEQKALNKKWK